MAKKKDKGMSDAEKVGIGVGLTAAAAAAAQQGDRIPYTLILHASVALYWALLCSIGYIAYTNTATAESRL